jgi:TatA/E family protein of Tat protein translocase
MHFGDTIFIFLLALVVFGPKKLPEIGRQIGKLMVEFRRASNDFKLQIEEELRSAEQAERQKALAAKAAEAAATESASGEPSILPPSEGSTVSSAANGGEGVTNYYNYNNEPPAGEGQTAAATAESAESVSPEVDAAAPDDPVAEAALAAAPADSVAETPPETPVSPNAERYYTNGSVEANGATPARDGATPARDEEPAQDQAPIHHV